VARKEKERRKKKRETGGETREAKKNRL